MSHKCEINILGFNEASWWHGFLHQGQVFLFVVLQPHMWCLIKPCDAGVDSLVPLQNEHTLLPATPIPPQISQVTVSLRISFWFHIRMVINSLLYC